jgi:hypothetical protein
MANGDNPNLAPKTRAGINEDTGKPRLREATEYKAGEYQPQGLTYPDDLLNPGAPYGGNYVIFYINVHEDSTLVKEIGESGFVKDSTPRERGDAAAQNITTAQAAAVGGTTGALAANGVGVAEKVAGTAGVPLKPGMAIAANTAIGAGTAGATLAAIGGANKQYKRLRQAIALHVPTDLSIKYGINWEEETTAGTAAMFAMSENLGKAAGNAVMGGIAGAALGGILGGKKGAKIGGALGAGAGAIAGGGADAAGAAGSYGAGVALRTPVGQFVSKTSGVAANPKKEQLFKSVDYRTFTFSYQFFPRTSEEAQSVREIIYNLKLHMHPEYKDAYHFLYVYPSEFDIYYYQNGKENLNLHRHTSCVLTDLSVSYSPQGVFTTFDDGMPTQINVQMTFKELALLSKETIKDGY